MHFQPFSVGVIISFLLCGCSGSSGDKSAAPVTNATPQLTSANRVEVNENRRGTFFSLTATDANGDTLTFAIEGADAALFAVDANTGALRFLQPPNFEAPADANADNRYELIAVVTDPRGARARKALTVEVVNVAFAYEFLSPLPDTIVERERYTRLPIALWMEYDYPERVEIKCDGEILNPASASRMTWTGSIQLGLGRVQVECVFWRGGQAIETLLIPVRHQYVISDDRHLVYDPLNDQIVIPHPRRLEVLRIDAGTGAAQKQYPWIGAVPEIQDIVADPINGGALYTAAGGVQRLPASGELATPVINVLVSATPTAPQSTLSYDSVSNHLYASGVSEYARISLPGGQITEPNYTSALNNPAGSRVESALDSAGSRLFLASGAATGVQAVTPDTAQVTASFPFTDPQRWGEIAYDPRRDSVFIRSWSESPLLRLDLATRTYTAVVGNGPELAPSAPLILDEERDRLLTLSGSRLLALDPDSGARTTIFDSSAGPGAVSSGFSGIWVAADSTRALALERQLGRWFEINLRSGEKTVRTYRWLDRNGAFTDVASNAFLPARDFLVEKAKFSADGQFAAVHYRNRDIGSTENYLDLIGLDSNSGKRIGDNADIIDFSFSRPGNQLMVLVRDKGQHLLSTYALPTGNLIERKNIPLALGFTVLAMQQIGADLYLLGRPLENSVPVFQLAVVNAGDQFTALATFPDEGAGQNVGAGISAMYHNSVLALELPEQSPQFWDLAAQAEFVMDFASFQGSDQPKDFTTIDDYGELYYFRTHAGLHICWRSNCTIQAN